MAGELWKPTIRAADALDSQRFTVAWGELAYDDPFTAILSYDGRFSQPWTRVDIEREIVALRHIQLEGQSAPVPIALSNEGDVYTLMEGRTDWSKIPGAGLLSDDAQGFGAVHILLVDESTQYVLGNSRQLYRRDGLGEWRSVSADQSAQNGYEAEYFGQATILPDKSILISSVQRPYEPPDPTEFDPEYWSKMTAEDLTRLMMKQQNTIDQRRPIEKLKRYRNDSFTGIEARDVTGIRDIYVDPQSNIWITGLFGLILCGNPEAGFERLGFQGDTEALFSCAWFRGEMIMATDDGLRRFDGHKLHVIKPVLSSPSVNRNVPTPLRVQACGDTLMYFDRKHGVCRWDGSIWDWVKIPPGLLARTFVGLRSP